MSKKVAVIGLGQMGSAIARRLRDAGFDVIGWDISMAARDRIASSGIAVGQSLAEVLEDRMYVLSSLPNGESVRTSWQGGEGLIALANPRAVLIELSTIEPSIMREVAELANRRGLQVLDCPVSGGPNEARTGKLVLMVGGSIATLDSAQSLLRALGDTIRHTGEVGTAKVVKIINNTMAMGNLLIACEAFSLGEAMGVDAETLFDVLSQSGGRSMTFTKRFPHALQGDFEARFKLALAEKDLRLGLAMARDLGTQAPAASLVQSLFAEAVSRGYGDKDAVAMLAMYRKKIQKQTANRK